MISTNLYIDFSALGISSFPRWLNSNYSLHNYIDFNRLMDNFVPGWFQITLNEFIMTINTKTSILQHTEIERNFFLPTAQAVLALSSYCTHPQQAAGHGFCFMTVLGEQEEKVSWFSLFKLSCEYICRKLWLNPLES